MKINRLVISLALVVAAYLPGMAIAACVDLNPVVTVTSIGGGQSAAVNKTLTASFRGHIMTTVGLSNHGKNAVKICPGTTVEYAITSTVGNGFRATPDCDGRFNFGVLTAGEKISCNNKNLGGRDSDSFTIKKG